MLQWLLPLEGYLHVHNTKGIVFIHSHKNPDETNNLTNKLNEVKQRPSSKVGFKLTGHPDCCTEIECTYIKCIKYALHANVLLLATYVVC